MMIEPEHHDQIWLDNEINQIIFEISR